MWPIITRFDLPFWPHQITIYSFGTFIVIAFLVSAFFARQRAHKRLGLDKERVFNVCFALLFLGLAGARLLYAFIHHEEFRQKPMSFLKIWEGGLTFYGGLFVGILWLAWYLSRKPEMKGFAFADVLALGTSLAIFVGRWASFLSGENYGKPSDVAWAVTFPIDPASQAKPQGVGLHPTQLYDAGAELLIMIFLLVTERRGRPFAGRTFWLYMLLYAISRYIIEIYRGDERGMIAGFSTSQFVSILLVPLSIIMLLRLRRR